MFAAPNKNHLVLNNYGQIQFILNNKNKFGSIKNTSTFALPNKKGGRLKVTSSYNKR